MTDEQILDIYLHGDTGTLPAQCRARLQEMLENESVVHATATAAALSAFESMRIIKKKPARNGFICLVHRGDAEFVTCFMRRDMNLQRDGWILGHYFYGDDGLRLALKDFEART